MAAVRGGRITLRLGHATVGYIDIDEGFLDGVRAPARLIVVLDELQKQFGKQFPIPVGLTIADLRELEMLHELMTNGRAQWMYCSISATIDGDQLEEFLASDEIQAEGGGLLVRLEGFAFTYGEHSFEVGPVQFWGPKMRLANLPELTAAVGSGSDPEARWVCLDGEHIQVQRMTGSHVEVTP